jgi:hemoglobin-like flavoprotein
MTGAVAMMESCLIAAAESDIDIRQVIFDRFFEAFPETRPLFYNLEAASGRMINETLEAMVGLADGAPWVATTVINFIDLHRNYGAIPADQYNAFIDITIEVLAGAVGVGWTNDVEIMWQRQAEQLKSLIVASL